MSRKHRAIVAMSGGVDSSVTAALLHAEGFEVVGITLQLYDHGAAVSKARACCAGQDIADAKAVADRIGFPHYTLDYESRFRQDVIDDFADSYLRGETPIPCVRCNQTVKFRDLLQTAQELGGDFLATGHYVQRLENAGRIELHRGADSGKDQSYFLFATTPEQLAFLRFPLGGMTKEQTRGLAQQFGLGTADKPDSQDICFVPTGHYSSLVQKLRPEALQPGQIVHLDGRVLGQHEGIIQYTVGQRKGLGIGGGEILYVIRLEPESRRVIVGPHEALACGEVMLSGVNWLESAPLAADGVAVLARVRSTRPPVPAVIYPEGQDASRMRVVFDLPQHGVSPGQACVFYQGDRVLGGGWITRSGANTTALAA
jgi:tRNA-uridine 2-sulfurtransferase